MTSTSLDVLLIESHPGIGSVAAIDLVAAGHQVHRCYDGVNSGVRCRGLEDPSACPIEDHVDVALVVRGGVSPRPSVLEDGVRCAIRAHVPLAEQGPEELDPFALWVLDRVPLGGDVEAACRRVADHSHEVLRREIERCVARLLASAAIDPGLAEYRFEVHANDLVVTVVLPIELSRRVKQAIAVRVLDTLRRVGRTYGRVDVNVTTDQAPG